MPLNIPLPSAPGEALSKGINSGGSLFSRIMQPILERERQKQQADQFKERQQQLESHFQQNFGLSKQNSARLAQAAADNHQIALNKLNPTWGIKELYELANNYQNNTQGLNKNKELNSNNNNELRDKLSSIGMFGQDKEMIQGQGVFPSDNQEGNPSYPVENNSNQNPVNYKPNLMQMIVGGILKKKTGVNPFEQDKESSYTGSAREGLDLVRLKKQFGENSEEYKNAQAIQHSKEQQRDDLSAIRQRQINGLKPGDTEIKDPTTGQTIGFNKQLDAKEREAAKNTVLFNHLYPLVYKISDRLTGPGASLALEKAARTYKTNPESKQLIDDYLIAEKAGTTTAVTEAARFGAGRTNQTFNRFVETLKSEDLPQLVKRLIKQYQIPAEANLKAGMQWQKELNTAEKLANKKIPATRAYYFDPDKQFQHEQQEREKLDNNSIEKEKKIKAWDNVDKKWVMITQEEFDKG